MNGSGTASIRERESRKTTVLELAPWTLARADTRKTRNSFSMSRASYRISFSKRAHEIVSSGNRFFLAAELRFYVYLFEGFESIFSPFRKN